MSIRNIAIIAHVDHGKTTLVDRMLQTAGVLKSKDSGQDRILDSNDLERERGITILSKNIAIRYGDTKINIIDTPGHADFGGEVERVLAMADGTLLLVDAFEGPMAQTRFVLRKALDNGLRPLVVINKIDRQGARPDEVLNLVFDLFVELGAPDDVLDFPVVYASAKNGFARNEVDDGNEDMLPLFEAILKHVPEPTTEGDGPFRMLVNTIDYDPFVGRIAVGRVLRGEISVGDSVLVSRKDRDTSARVAEVFEFDGLGRKKTKTGIAGDIVAIQGVGDIDVGDTISDSEHPDPLPRVEVDAPTISMVFRVNDSPFAGKDGGKFLTSRHLRERLFRETRSNVALRVQETDETDALLVSGRGVLHLSILIENMRREGYEFAVGKPKVIFREIDGKTCEPIERLVLDVSTQASGKVIEILGVRKAMLDKMEGTGERTLLEFDIPARGLIGLRSRILTVAGGEVVMNHYFQRYERAMGDLPSRANGVMVSMDSGMSTAYAMDSLGDRGIFFIKPGDPVYEGMICGEHCKSQDIIVNACRLKKLTNIRSSGADKKILLEPPRILSLEDALEFIEDDELLEVTPKSLRLRKRHLKYKARKAKA